MSEDVTFYIRTDISDANASMDTVAAKGDKVVKDWVEKRRIILSQIREGMSMVTSLISSFREAMSIIGAQISPFFDAVLGMISATISMLLSVAAAYTASVVGAPYAVVISTVAVGLGVVSWAQAMASKAQIIATSEEIQSALKAAGVLGQGMLGGSF
jgi:hypothetical protein